MNKKNWFDWIKNFLSKAFGYVFEYFNAKKQAGEAVEKYEQEHKARIEDNVKSQSEVIQTKSKNELNSGLKKIKDSKGSFEKWKEEDRKLK